MIIRTYSAAAVSALRLAIQLGCKVITPKNQQSAPIDELIVNWGSSEPTPHTRVLNNPVPVAIAVNKIAAFALMKDKVQTVPATTDDQTAILWLAEGHRVFARHKIEAADGEGMEEIFLNNGIPKAPLYTRFVPSDREYRVTCCRDTKGNVIPVFVQRRVPVDIHLPRHDVKTSSNGYGFRHVTHGWSQKVMDEACKAVEAIGLDFGGVDVLYRIADNHVAVLEVNTAPELTPLSTKALATAIEKLASVR